jgi:hypothetical protein
MRTLKGSSSYLKNQVRKNLAKAALSMLLLCAVLFALALRVLSTWQVGFLEEAALVFCLVPLTAFAFYFHKYHIYNGGWQGERQVEKYLRKTLSDDYFLINDLYIPDGGGDIDHVILASNGIFVLETKNWSGKIFCRGDEWQRAGKRSFSASPSRQVKRNATRVRRLIGDLPSFRGLDVWVESIVVFSNKHAALDLNNPTVPVVKLPQLVKYIISHGNAKYAAAQLAALGKEIVKWQRR